MIQNLFILTDDLPKPKTTEIIRKGSITEYTAAEEKEDGRRWRMFRIGEQDHRVDMKAIEPYKKVISHGGKSYQRLFIFLVQYQKCKCLKKLSYVKNIYIINTHHVILETGLKLKDKTKFKNLYYMHTVYSKGTRVYSENYFPPCL